MERANDLTNSEGERSKVESGLVRGEERPNEMRTGSRAGCVQRRGFLCVSTKKNNITKN